LKRVTPISIDGEDGAAKRLANLTGLSEDVCGTAIEETLLAAYDHQLQEDGTPLFAFRLHQFISRGDTIYASLENTAEGISPHAASNLSLVIVTKSCCLWCFVENAGKNIIPFSENQNITVKNLSFLHGISLISRIAMN
jgi:hypothetical protein